MNLYNKLEFKIFVDKLKKYSFSQYGKQYIDKLQFSDNPKFEYDLIKHIVDILSDSYKISNLVYIDDLLEKLKIDVLEATDLVKIKKYFEGVENIKNFIFKNEDLSLFFADFMDYNPLIKKISSSITEDGKIKDDASSELKTIRHDLRKIKKDMKNQVEKILNKYSPYLQERIVTFRNARLVLPFKASFKNKINGVVQDTSSTGSTVFIEPTELVFLNNEIRTLESKERYEIMKILSSISHKIRLHLDKIYENKDLIAFFDSLYTRACYLLEENCVIPNLNTNSYIKIVSGRNPVIPNESVVPLDFELGKENYIVVITGPNTGGKTVTLKTIGIFSLMAKMAIPIPANYADLALFDNIFVDIGDEQAMQQNLSTFSSHMKAVIHALNNMDINSLILFDELGAGTDPMEGSALAIAVVDYLLSNKIRGVITTHYNELKLYAYSNKYIENASMQFDVNSLSPTYRLLMGIPGSSNAFEISKRLGMKSEIIDKAKEFKGKEYEDMDRIIDEIHKEKASILSEKQKILNTRKELELKKHQYDSMIDRIKSEGIKSIDKDYARLKTLKKEIEQMVARVKKTTDLYELKKTNKKLQYFLREVKDFNFEEDNSKNSRTFVEDFKVGDLVRIHSSNGKIISINGDKAKIDINGILVESNLSNLKKIDNYKLDNDDENSIAISYTTTSFSPKLDLRGYRVEDAIEAIEHFIYELKLREIDCGTIVHGKGTGALMVAVHDYLRDNKSIKSFRFGTPEEGGEGATIIEV